MIVSPVSGRAPPPCDKLEVTSGESRYDADHVSLLFLSSARREVREGRRLAEAVVFLVLGGAMTTLYSRIFTEAHKPSFLDSVHSAVKAADISDANHPWHRFFSKVGALGRALQGAGGGTSSSKAHGSKLLAVKHSPHGQPATPSARDTLRSLKRDVRDVGRSRARASREGATLRAMGRAQAGTGPRRSPSQPRRKAPGMEPPIR